MLHIGWVRFDLGALNALWIGSPPRGSAIIVVMQREDVRMHGRTDVWKGRVMRAAARSQS